MDMRRAQPGISPLLLLSALLHLIFWYFLPKLHSMPPENETRPSMVLRIIPITPALPTPPAPPTPSPSKAVAASVAPTLATSRARVVPPTTQTRIALAEKAITKENDPPLIVVQPELAPQAVPTPSLAERARSGLGKIDGELWAELPAPARSARMGKTGPLPLEKAIAAAAKPRTGTVETVYGTDGQQYTKYHGPFGTYCIWVPKVKRAATAGTPQENASYVTTCPV